MDFEAQLTQLSQGPIFPFADWPNPEVPPVAAGVYTVWDQQGQYVYVGMSGRGMTEQALKTAAGGKRKGLWTRLASHASGRRSGDQFCVYVADRLVLPTLSSHDIKSIATKEQSFDARVKDYIRENLSYRFVVVESGSVALEIEHAAAFDGLTGQWPLLNPR